MKLATPSILVPRPWGKHIAFEVQMDEVDVKLLGRIRSMQKVISSQAICSIFLLISRGIHSPGEIAAKTFKSKFAVSLQISQLKEAGLVTLNRSASDDMRQRNYEISWNRVVEIFRQDHALELELYENYLLAESLGQIRGTMRNTELAIMGSGRLGLVREVIPAREVETKGNLIAITRLEGLYREFGELFRAYLHERRFATIREYFLGICRELSMSYRRLPRKSELAHFFEFVDRSLARISPIEELFKRNVLGNRANGEIAKNFGNSISHKEYVDSVKLFMEAGRTDYAGRYILNSEARALIKPGVRVRVYPSYTFME